MISKNYLSEFNLIIRSFLFWILSVVSFLIYGPFTLLLYPFFPLKKRCQIASGWVRLQIWLLKTLCHVKYTVIGLENIPKERTGIVLAKHQSMWETFLLPLVFDYPAVILKRELLRIPIFGWILMGVGCISIDRNDKIKAREKVLALGKKHLLNGRWILLFPEGTRTKPGHVGTYKSGGAHLAVQTESPIIPVAHNAGNFWPPKQFIKKPGHIKVIIGPLIESTAKTPETLIAETKHWIETTMLQIQES